MLVMDRVATAGAFVQSSGRWIFAVGPTSPGDRLGIVRLGGHREKGETPWECASREASEEAAIQIEYLDPPATYWFDGDSQVLNLERWPWPFGGLAPLVVATAGEDDPVTLLYLARTDQAATPSAETQGLLFLSPGEISRLVTEPLTLSGFLQAGGHAILRPGFPAELQLVPFYHIRLLHRILALHPELL